MSVAVDAITEQRARLSLGRSDDAIHATVAALLREHGAQGLLADIGCGRGDLWRLVKGQFSRGIGVDAARYADLPIDVDFRACDLDRGPLPLDTGSIDAVTAVEVIEHLENPRAFCRELSRVTRVGGWIVVTTPNQLSAASLLSLVFRGHFGAFQDADYPAHRTALLETDLRRIAAECGWRDVTIAYTRHGRIPLTAAHYPRVVAGLAPARFSDNVVLTARR